MAYALRPLLLAWSRSHTDDDEDDWDALGELGDFFDEMADDGPGELIASSLGDPLHQPAVVDDLTIRRQLDWLEVAMGEWADEDTWKEVMQATAEAVDGFALEELGSVLAVDLRREVPGLGAVIDQWRDSNVELIRSCLFASDSPIRPGLLEDLSATIEEAHREGLRVELLGERIRERFEVSDRRAAMIARDQVLTLNGQVTKHRQTAAGVTKYRWSTSRDARVRDSHQNLEGTVQKWAVAPDVGHPGDDILCRCVAIPIAPDWMEV